MRRFPASVYFSSIRMQMDNIIRDKHAVEDGRAKAAADIAKMPRDERWDLCRVAYHYSANHQWVEAQRLFHACFLVKGGDKSWYPTLIQCDLNLGDFAAVRKDMAGMEKDAPDLYRQLKSAYDMQVPVDG